MAVSESHFVSFAVCLIDQAVAGARDDIVPRAGLEMVLKIDVACVQDVDCLIEAPDPVEVALHGSFRTVGKLVLPASQNVPAPHSHLVVEGPIIG